MEWLVDDVEPMDATAERQLARSLPAVGEALTRGPDAVPCVAVLLHDVVVHDVRKWFGKADVRLDSLVLHGYGAANDPSSFYAPETFRFARVQDGAKLDIGAGGLLLFHGRPLHFLALFLTLSRDTGDTDSLATLLRDEVGMGDVPGALGGIVGLAAAEPHVAAVTGALAGAAVLGDVMYRIVRTASGATIGLYRNTLLQFRDGFGVGRHPGSGAYRAHDFSFWYEVVLEQ